MPCAPLEPGVRPSADPRARGYSRAGPLRRLRALAAEVVLDADDVVQLRGRDLDERAGLDRLEAMEPRHRHVRALARTELADLDLAPLVLERERQPPGEDVDPLVLDLVALEREPLAGVDDDELADV